MQKLQSKIAEHSRRVQDVRDRFNDLKAKKRKAAAAASEAMAKNEIDSAMECEKLQDDLEADIKALEGIMAAFGREKPFNANEFFEEFNQFKKQQEAALSGKYNELVDGLAELDRLYSSYEAQYRWYSSQLATWQDMGNKISLGSLPKAADETAVGLHRKIKNGLSGLTKEINQ